MKKKDLKISVIGAGSWGTALARMTAKKGLTTTIWAFEKEVSTEINEKHSNSIYLKGIALPETLRATSDLEEAVSGRDILLSVVPSHVLRTVAKKINNYIKIDSIFVSCTKGIETSTGKYVSEILEETLTKLPKEQITYLSGPSFAVEVAADLPTTVVIAGSDREVACRVQEALRTPTFMTFIHDDIIGVELGGALKNVIAIASGISDGLGFGNNSRAALITRGLYEMIKIGKALGANPLTFSGLTGIGDLVLTCTSTKSRNYTVGLRLGRGEKLKDIQESMMMVAEGVKTTKAIYKIIRERKIKAPICGAIYEMLYEEKDPKEAARELFNMELQEELRSILT